MTRAANARLAGVTFLLYIAAGMTSMGVGETSATGVLGLVMSLCALVLGVTLYALTRQQDPDLALLALSCRIVEAMSGTAQTGAIFFAAGSTLFAWLLLRGRMIPIALAWLGVAASVLLVIILPLQRAGFLGGETSWSSSITWMVWLPMLVFEIALALWLIVKGAAAPTPERQPVGL